MNILDRIKYVVKQKGISISNIEKDLGFGNKTIYRWDKADPSISKVIAVADYLDVDLEWLATGKEEIHINNYKPATTYCTYNIGMHSDTPNQLLDRIKKIAKEQGLTISNIEEKLSFGKNSMYRWDINSPSVDKVILVANLLNTSVDYLITENNMNIYPYENNKSDDFINRYNKLSESDKGKINTFIEIASLKEFQSNDYNNNKKQNIMKEDNIHYNTNKKEVPILGKVAAGIPIPLVEGYLDQAEAPSDNVDFATVAKGESMEPVIHDGENIFIKSVQSLDNGDIGVFDIDGETTCKKFKYDLNTKTVILTSFNSAFKPLKYPLKNYQDTFRIIGKVILTDKQNERYHSFIHK